MRLQCTYSFGQAIFDYWLNVCFSHDTDIRLYALDLAPHSGRRPEDGFDSGHGFCSVGSKPPIYSTYHDF